MVIGIAPRPLEFKKKKMQVLCFDYYANKKSWMTQQILFDWLHRLGIYIGRTPSRKVIFILDNCTTQGKKGNTPTLVNVSVDGLSPNTISKVRPLDGGLIAWVKASLNRRLHFCIFENIEFIKKYIYNVEILTAIR